MNLHTNLDLTIKMDIYNDLVGVQVQKAGICSEKDLRNRQNMLSW